MSVVESIMTRDLVVGRPDETVTTAVERLGQADVGALLVVQEDALIGIVSEREYEWRALAGAPAASSSRRARS